MKVVIIGQAPSRVSDPREPLSGRSGARLAALCGITLPEFLDRFDRRNLLDAWPGKAGKGDVFVGRGEARLLADGLRAALAGRPIVLLGANLAAAFRSTEPAFRFSPSRIAWSPHPSGISRWWNDPANEERARRFWRSLVSPDFSPNDL